MASTGWVYGREYLKHYADHVVEPLSDVSFYNHLKRSSSHMHTGNLHAVTGHGNIRDQEHARKIAMHAYKLGEHMGNRLAEGRHF